MSKKTGCCLFEARFPSDVPTMSAFGSETQVQVQKQALYDGCHARMVGAFLPEISWARLRRTNPAIPRHGLLDHDGYLPALMEIAHPLCRIGYRPPETAKGHIFLSNRFRQPAKQSVPSKRTQAD